MICIIQQNNYFDLFRTGFIECYTLHHHPHKFSTCVVSSHGLWLLGTCACLEWADCLIGTTACSVLEKCSPDRLDSQPTVALLWIPLLYGQT